MPAMEVNAAVASPLAACLRLKERAKFDVQIEILERSFGVGCHRKKTIDDFALFPFVGIGAVEQDQGAVGRLGVQGRTGTYDFLQGERDAVIAFACQDTINKDAGTFL